ncbi:MAG: barstar family protein [Pseudomonadota bacterium]
MKRYVIDGTHFQTLEEFWSHFQSEVLGGQHWGRNLDAFSDVLRGGFGTPEEGFILEWRNSEHSRQTLGYTETIRQLRKRLECCHPSATAKARTAIAAAERGEGPTVFDWLVEILKMHELGGGEGGSRVELVLL